MKETMGQIIRRLRRARDLTQEELAEQLNLSAAAISKWENDTSMPDISQVVPLANLFGVPTDVLFGVHEADHEAEVRARLEEIFRMCDNCPDGKEAETALVILDQYREAMRLYPNHSTILVNAMAFAEMVLSQNGAELKALIGQTGIDALTQEIVRWAELVIKYSTSLDDVLSAKRRLMEIRVKEKNWAEARAIADTFPREVADIRGIRRAYLHRQADELAEERACRCWNIRALVEALGHQVFMLGDLYMREEQYADALYCYTFMQELLDAMYREEAYRPPFVYDHHALFRAPACCLMKLDRADEAVACLEKGAAFVLAQAEHYNRRKTLDVPLLRDCSFGYGYDGAAAYTDVTGKLRNLVCHAAFAPLAENPRYRALLDLLGLAVEE